jgi:hypothetical protein
VSQKRQIKRESLRLDTAFVMSASAISANAAQSLY